MDSMQYSHILKVQNITPPPDDVMCVHVLNLTEKSRAEFFLYLPEEKWVFLVMLPMLLIFGVISNGLFLFVICSLKEMRTSTNFYLANLAFADVFFLTVSIGQNMSQYLFSPIRRDYLRSGSNFGCCFLHFIAYLCYYASIFLVTLLAVERFYAVCLPLKHMPLKGKKRTLNLTLGTWFLSAIFAGAYLPRLAIFKAVCLLWPEDEEYADLPQVYGTCSSIYDWTNILSSLTLIVPFYTAFFANCILYALIVRTLGKRGADGKDVIATPTNDSVKIRHSIARMLIANGIVFFVCQAPYQSTAFGSAIVDVVRNEPFLDYRQYLIWTWIAATLLYINSIVNPIIYNVMSSRYREAFKKALRWKRWRLRMKSDSRISGLIGSDDDIQSSPDTEDTYL